MLEPPTVRELRSGPTIVARTNESDPMIAIQLWSPRGSASAFEKTAGHPMLFAEVWCQRRHPPSGIATHWWSTHDATVCEFEAPRELADELVKHVRGIFSAPQNEAEAEKLSKSCQRLNDSWRVSRSDPQRMAIEHLFTATFGESHPYSRPVLGHIPCDELDQESTQNQLEHWFGHDDLVITVAGHADIDEIANQLDGTRGAKSLRLESAHPQEKSRRTPLFKVETSVTDVSRISAALRLGEPTPERRAFAELLLDVLISSSRGRLSSSAAEIRHRLHDYRGFVFNGRTDLALIITGESEPGETLIATVQLARILESLAAAPPTIRELARARDTAQRRRRRARLDAAGVARELGFAAATSGDPTQESKVSQLISKLPHRDVVELAQKLVHPGSLTVTSLVPEHLRGTMNELPQVTDDEGSARVDGDRLEARLAELTSHDASDSDEAELEALGESTSRWQGRHGSTLLVRQEREAPALGIRLSVPIEANRISDFVGGSLSALRQVINAAIPSELRWNEDQRWGIRVTNSQDEILLEAVAHPSDAEDKVVELLMILFRPFRGLEESVYEALAGRRTRATPTDRELGEFALLEALFLHEPWRWNRPRSGSESEPPSLEEVQSLHQTLVRPGGLVLTVVGNVDDTAMVRAFSTTLELLEREEEDDHNQTQERSLPPSGHEIRQLSENQTSLIWLGFPTLGYADESWRALAVLRELLDHRQGQLDLRLARPGLTHDSGIEYELEPRSGAFVITAATVPTSEREVLDVLRSIIDELRDSTLTSFELQRARRAAALRWAQQLATPLGRARLLCQAHRAGLAPTSLLTAPTQLLDVDEEEFRAGLTARAGADHDIIVVVGPEMEEEAADSSEQDNEDDD